MFIGHFGVGKTTLVKQLQGLSATGVESTDGIDVYRGKCYYNTDTKEWITPGKYDRDETLNKKKKEGMCLTPLTNAPLLTENLEHIVTTQKPH